MRGREQGTGNREQPARDGEEGYLLLGAIIAVALVMIALSVAAVKVSFELRREREEESVRRANQYVRAIREYYLKFGRYPGSVEQLKNTNNIRFLRQEYVDPLTGKPDYRLIIVGQNKTTPKGFFGEPLSGLPGGGAGTGGAGAPSGASGNGITSNGAAGVAGPGAGAFGSGFGSGSTGNTATMGFGGGGTPTAGAAQGAPANGPGTPTTPGAATSSSSSGSSGPGSSLGPIMGVGSSATGTSIITVNEQTSYEGWEFLYDPRVERLRQQGQLNQGVGSAGGNTNPAGLGSTPQSGAPAGTAAPGAGGGQSAPTTGVPVQP